MVCPFKVAGFLLGGVDGSQILRGSSVCLPVMRSILHPWLRKGSGGSTSLLPRFQSYLTTELRGLCFDGMRTVVTAF